MPIVALNNVEHKDLKVNPAYLLAQLAGNHMVPVVVHECAILGSDAPIVFVKNQETGQFQMVVLYGLAPGENLFLVNDSWQAMTVPLAVQSGPFRLISDGADDDRMMIGIDNQSPFLGSEEGEALFDADGQETEFLKARKEVLGHYFEGDQITRAFIDLLSELELLVQRELKLNANGEKIEIGGLYSVDEAKLGDLSPEDFEQLRTRGFLPVVYAQLMSMHQVRRLARLRAKA